MTSNQKLLVIFLLIHLSITPVLTRNKPRPQANPSKRQQQPSDGDRQRFQAWKQKFQKVYSSTTDEDRAMSVMITNQREIDAHNELFQQGKVTFTRATWENSDLDLDEKLKILTGNKPLNESVVVKRSLKQAANFKTGPNEVNWVKSGLVTSIRNQGKCGSCWSFTAVGIADGVLLKKGIKTRLSEQNLVDCSKANYGCDGGDAYLALKYVAAKGISSLADYPYTGKDGKCRTAAKVDFSLGQVKLERLRGNENRLKDIVASVGPVGIAVDAADSFMNYKSGVYNNPKCSKRPNHAMLLVGYGRDEKTSMDYWLVKNSWVGLNVFLGVFLNVLSVFECFWRLF
jgi:cathepsin L